jgi:hypothetical protein
MARIAGALGLLALFAAAACGGGGDAGPTATLAPAATLESTATSAADPMQTPRVDDDEISPADSDTPAAGVCAEPPEENVATWTINPDVPSPRCGKVRREQHLSFVNATDETVEIVIGPYTLRISPDGTEEINEPAGSYLAPGVHVARTSTYGGESGPEVWLLE